MIYTDKQKRYRNTFIMLTLFAIFGIMAGILLYEYTGFFDILQKDSLELNQAFTLSGVLEAFFEEFKIFALIFLFGFTLFSSAFTSGILIYKGFLCGFSVIYFGIGYNNRAMAKNEYVFLISVLIATLICYIFFGARAMTFSSTLKYTAPDIAALLKQNFAKKYIITFLVITAVIAIISALKCAAPLIK